MERTNNPEGVIFKIKRFSVHDGPGIRTTVFLKGCPLKCVWCHSPEGINSEISIWYNPGLCIGCSLCANICSQNALELVYKQKPYIIIDRSCCKSAGDCIRICPTNAIQFTGSVTSVNEIINEISKDLVYYQSSGGGVTLTGGEPLFQPVFSAAILKSCKEKEIHTAIETCLYCNRGDLDMVMDHIDLFIIDIKVYDDARHKFYTGKSNKLIKENFHYIATSGKK
jgi:pyruvate formate lyase activating enzyme